MTKQKILITEDDRLSAEYLKEILEEAGYEINQKNSDIDNSTCQGRDDRVCH